MLFTIFIEIIFPIFFMIGVGTLIGKLFKQDLPTLSRLNFYVFVPSLLFLKILESDSSPREFASIALYNVILILLLGVVSYLVFSLPSFKKHRSIMSLGTLFFNAGNYGIPLVLLAFGDKFIGIVAATLMVQSMLNFSMGIWIIRAKDTKVIDILKGFLRIPVIYALIAALVLKYFHVDLQESCNFLYQPLNYLSAGLIPVALLTLGIQIAQSKLTLNFIPLLTATAFVRLILSPVIAWLLTLLMGFSPEVSAVLIVIAGLPTAVNVFILASEFKKDEDLASQMVLVSTIISSITLIVLIHLLR